jgi:hypothetical protein
MKPKNNLLKELVRFCIWPLVIFAALKGVVDELLTNFIVNPILSKCTPSSWIYDIAVFGILCLVLVPFFYKIYKGAKIPLRWALLAITTTLMYLFYRLPNSKFEFTPTTFLDSVKLLDIVFLIPFGITLTYIVLKLRNKNKDAKSEENEEGFIPDEPILIDEQIDFSHRLKFINEIVKKINNTKSTKGSFPIGVVAPWGSGKTTFLDTLSAKLDTGENIIVELSTWKCSNSALLIETFFKSLREGLKPYSFSIDNKLQEYTTSLLKGTKNEGINAIKNITETVFPHSSIEKQYNLIKEEVETIGKRIIVFIDDLDRLDAQEIYEVIRIIRNTANFPNTFFIVAYDRNYVLNAIEKINPHNPYVFLEKIFQVEFALPPIDDKVLQNIITKRFENFLSTESFEGYKKVLETYPVFRAERSINLTDSFILNFRDTIRFINAFKLSYAFVKDEVYFPDFYNLELIRFKHPEIFSEIYREYSRYFTTEKISENIINTITDTYCLKLKKDENDITKSITEIEVFLVNNMNTYKITKKDILSIASSYDALFPQTSSMYESNTKRLNVHLSVVKPSMFKRYFSLGIEGRLSEIKFSNMRQLPLPQFKAALTEICKNQDLLIDLSDRFEEIREFDTKDDFEKIVTVIFYFANLKYPTKSNKSNLEQIRYNSRSLKIVLDDEKNTKYYNSIRDYENFVLSILKTSNWQFTYTNEFVNYLYREICNQRQGGVFYSQDIGKVLVQNFETAIEKATFFSEDLWNHFLNYQPRVESEIIPKYEIPEDMKIKMRKFILTKDLDGFLCFIIEEKAQRYTISWIYKKVFKSLIELVNGVQESKVDSLYREEFLAFYNELNSNNDFIINGVPKDFFKVIPVKLASEQEV